MFSMFSMFLDYTKSHYLINTIYVLIHKINHKLDWPATEKYAMNDRRYDALAHPIDIVSIDLPHSVVLVK